MQLYHKCRPFTGMAGAIVIQIVCFSQDRNVQGTDLKFNKGITKHINPIVNKDCYFVGQLEGIADVIVFYAKFGCHMIHADKKTSVPTHGFMNADHNKQRTPNNSAHMKYFQSADVFGVSLSQRK